MREDDPIPESRGQVLFWVWVIAVGVIVIGFVAAMYSGFGRDPHAVPFELRGKPAPSFKLRRIDTGELMSFDSMKGRPIVINFWASWCEPCKLEHPYLTWASKQYATQAQFVGIVFEDTEENVKAFLAEHGAPFAQLSDPNSRTCVDYGVAGVPETYFIDSNGIIVDKYVGPMSPNELTEHLRAITGS